MSIGLESLRLTDQQRRHAIEGNVVDFIVDALKKAHPSRIYESDYPRIHKLVLRELADYFPDGLPDEWKAEADEIVGKIAHHLQGYYD
jgi:hypothetical protein